MVDNYSKCIKFNNLPICVKIGAYKPYVDGYGNIKFQYVANKNNQGSTGINKHKPSRPLTVKEYNAKEICTVGVDKGGFLRIVNKTNNAEILSKTVQGFVTKMKEEDEDEPVEVLLLYSSGKLNMFQGNGNPKKFKYGSDYILNIENRTWDNEFIADPTQGGKVPYSSLKSVEDRDIYNDPSNWSKPVFVPAMINLTFKPFIHSMDYKAFFGRFSINWAKYDEELPNDIIVEPGKIFTVKYDEEGEKQLAIEEN